MNGVTLSRRELEVLALIADGRSAKTTARELHLAPRTVERLIQDCRQKLDARNTTELVALAITGGHLVRRTRMH